MNWSDEAVAKAWELLGGRGTHGDAMRRVMDYAAELLAARGGTMTAAQISKAMASLVNAGVARTVEPVRMHLAAQGAGVAMLRDLADLRGAEIDRFHEAAQHDQATMDAHREKVAALEAENGRLKGLLDLAQRKTLADVEETERLRDERDVFRAELARAATNSEAWRQRYLKAADALSGVAPGGLGRLDLLGRIGALKAERDDYREKMLSEAGKFMAEMQRADRLEDELTKHVARGALGLPNPPTSSESSGQVAEDVADLRTVVNAFTWSEHSDRWRYEAALSRLAALAGKGQGLLLKFDEAHGELNDLDAPCSPAYKAGWRAALAFVRQDTERASSALHPSLPPEAFTEAKGLDAGALADDHVASIAQGATACVAGTCGHVPAPGLDAEPATHPKAFARPTEHCTCAGEGTCAWCDKAVYASASTYSPAAASAYEQGAEGMRAACWEAVQAKLHEFGMHETGPIGGAIKAAIEGAAP